VQSVRLRLLGPLHLDGGDTAGLDRRQVRTFLKVLGLGRGQAVTVDRLVDCLWGDHPPAHPNEQVSVLASRLRAVVGADRVVRSDAGYLLLVDWLDLDALAGYLHEADLRLASGSPAAARTSAAAGLALVRGPLLADEADPRWAETDRAATDLLIGRLHRIVADAALAAGDWSEAAHRAQALLVADPYDESALRTAMEALARSNRKASALAVYAAVRERLADELGVDPAEETEALHGAILTGSLAALDRAPPETAVPLRLPGRERALEWLDAVVDRARNGEGQLAVVEGEAGMGKSRLLEVWGHHLDARGIEVVSVACDELGRALPLQPLLDVVETLVRRSTTPGADDVLGSDRAVLGPLLATPSGPGGNTGLTMLTDPGAGLALLFAALFGVLHRHAEHRTLVVTVDDIHLADRATIAWLGQAARRLGDTRVAIVAARRAEEGGALPGASTFSLGPLGLVDVESMVGPARAGALFDRSGGHPLFVVELATAESDEAMPATITDAVAERCARAGPAAATLRTAALIGPEIDLDVLAAVTTVPSAELLDHLEEGLRRRFLIEVGQTFVFAHALIREALATTVGAARTAFIHREAARALGARPDADPLAIARHARLGGDRALASAMTVAAARLAVSRFDPHGAMDLLDEAIALDDTVDARLERARVASMSSLHDQAGKDLAAARRAGAGPELLEVAAWSAHYQRHFDEALALADRGAQESVDPEVRTSCLALGGWVSLAAGDLHGAEARLVGALDGSPRAGSGMAGAWMAWLRMNQGRPRETLRLVGQPAGRGLAAYRFPNAYGGMVATMALAMLGRPDEALVALDALAADVADMHAERWTPRPLNLRGWIVRNLGALEEADDLNRAAIEAARARGLDEPWANGLLDLASGRLVAGDVDGAGALLQEASPFAEVEHAFRWRHQLRARLLQAALDRATGAFEAARAGATALATDAEELGAPRYVVQARLEAAMATHQQGGSIDIESVELLLAQLDEVAGLEAWRITAAAATAFDVAAWRAQAGRRVAALQRRSGPYGEALGRAASRVLD
jgi:DNA-binding SARP family transcriptional activator